MKNFSFFNKHAWFFCAIFSLLCPEGFAVDGVHHISAPASEIYQAAREVLSEAGGITEEDADSYYVRSEWMEDTVIRERHRPLIGVTRQAYQRRTRISYQITPSQHISEVVLKAEFRYRDERAVRHAPWRSLRPSREDLSHKRLFFQKLLERLSRNRRASNP